MSMSSLDCEPLEIKTVIAKQVLSTGLQNRSEQEREKGRKGRKEGGKE